MAASTRTQQQINFLLPRPLYAALVRYAQDTDMKISGICRRAIEAYLRERQAYPLDEDEKKSVQ